MNNPSSTHDNPSRPSRTICWLLLPLAVFPLVALLTYDWHAIVALQTPPAPSANWIGAAGDAFAYWGYTLFGLAIWAVPVICILGVIARMAGHHPFARLRPLWLAISLVALSAMIQPLQGRAPGMDAMVAANNLSSIGGVTGYLLMTRLLVPLLGLFGALVLSGVTLLVTLIATIGAKNIANFFLHLLHWASEPESDREEADDDAASVPGDAADEPAMSERERRREEKRLAREARAAEKEAKRLEREAAKERAEQDRQRQIEALNAARAAAAAERGRNPPAAAAPAKAATKEEPPTRAPTTKAAEEPASDDKGPYLLPSLSLLNPLKQTSADHSDVGEMSRRLVDTLKLFGIDATVAYDVQGPVVTKYALSLAPGTKYSAVTGISDNLMGALRAKSLRIEAPIPGEDHIGIEVPNRAPAGISFREIFESEAWRNFKGELPLLFGKDAAGKELVADLAKMPHMLVAGATGQGKSVCLNAIINGLLMTKTPEQLKLIMVDPKSVEFTSYAAIPHLIVPIITENRKAASALAWAVVEMEKRLKLFARARVRNIYDFNHRKSFTQTELFGDDTELGGGMPKTVPYVVVIIDEVADLMSQCAKEVVPHISRIAAKARAAGIHLILATQRPDAKVITGTIKANIPGRVAFKTATAIDSRTILDDSGAENLIGRGDMLFKAADGVLIRAQGAWITDEEIARVTGFIEQHANTQFDEKFKKNLDRIKDVEIDPFADLTKEDDAAAAKVEAAQARENVKAAADADDFKKALECVINTKRASTSHFQRQMGWGYNHAAKILDMLTAKGVVSPQQGMGPRSIIMDENTMIAMMNGDDGTDVQQSVPEEAPVDGEELFNHETEMEEPQT